MTDEMLRVGAALGRELELLALRVAVVISADLAHTHLASGPYGYSAAAEPFDKAVGSWAATLADAPLLVNARTLAADALSCGYTGLVMLHGLFTRSKIFAPDKWRPMARGPFALAHPTYYGMLVAGFDRVS